MLSISRILEEHQETLYYKKDLAMIKNAWLNHIQTKQPHTCLDYYYLGMAKNAVALLNQVSYDLFLNHHCHKGVQFNEDIADNRARDICELYRHQHLSFESTKQLLEDLTTNEKFYFFVRLVYPSFYFDDNLNVDFSENYIVIYRKQVCQMMNYLKDYITIPALFY